MFDLIIDITLDFLEKYCDLIFFSAYTVMLILHLVWTYLGL